MFFSSASDSDHFSLIARDLFIQTIRQMEFIIHEANGPVLAFHNTLVYYL